jgi:phosphatidylserine/phosphatidylglycerophosphate/cardiolipin synthase-like enzyme
VVRVSGCLDTRSGPDITTQILSGDRGPKPPDNNMLHPDRDLRRPDREASGSRKVSDTSAGIRFSSPILAALVAAKERGADVIVILDKSDDYASSNRRATGAEFVARAGIPILIDFQPAIAHNKVIIVDKHIVVTGSYNFTSAAEHRNAENVTIIDSSEVASRFLSNWESRRALSRPFEAIGH